MKFSSLTFLSCCVHIMTTSITYLNSNETGNNNLSELILNTSLGNENYSKSDNERDYTSGFETMLERVATAIDIYFTPILVTFGISGNLLSVYVFYSSKLRLQSISQYLSALAISDSIFLIQLIPPWLSMMEITGLFYEDAFCKAFVYLSYVSCCLSSWLVIAFTFERFVAVQYPLQRNVICTVKRARYVILVLTVGALVINLPVIHFAGSVNQSCHIDIEKLEQAARFNWIDTTVTFTLPISLVVLLNTWIVTLLYKCERERTQLITDELQAAALNQRGARDRDLIYPHYQRRITNMLLIVSSIYVVFNCPAYTLRVCGYIYDMKKSKSSAFMKRLPMCDNKIECLDRLDYKWQLAQKVATMLFNLNFGINFYLYCFSGQNFRRALVETVPCFGYIIRENRADQRSTTIRRRTCSATTTVGSPGTSARSMETSFARPSIRWRRRGSDDYIMRIAFDNSGQRGATALGEASDAISMREITSRPGPSRLFSDEQSQPGPSFVSSLERQRPAISRRSDLRSQIDLRRQAIVSRSFTIDQRPSTIRPSSRVREVASAAVNPRRRPVIDTQPRGADVPEVVVEKRKPPAVCRYRRLFRRSKSLTREEKAQLYD